MHSAKILKMGDNKGKPRVWLEGETVRKSGFDAGQPYDVEIQKDKVVLVAKELLGSRTVSCKKSREKTIPIIDLNSDAALAPLKGAQVIRVVYSNGRITISKIESEIRRQERIERIARKIAAGAPIEKGGICAGAGILTHAAHAGLQAAGLETRTAFINEIREDLIEHAIAVNPAIDANTQMLNMPLQELAFDSQLLQEVGEVEVLEIGIPCSGASISGASKLGLKKAEDHPHVGHLVVGALALIARLNPNVVVFENVPQYENTASASIIRKQLADLGYDVQETLFVGTDYGALEKRKRWSLVAVTRGIDFDLQALKPGLYPTRTVAEMLEPHEMVEDRYTHMTGLKAKELRDREAGKGFRMQVYNGSETSINTLTAGLAKNRSTDPKIQHPTNPDLLRIPTVNEHARMKGIPEYLAQGLSQTQGHEMLGQSIVYECFRRLFQHIGQSLRAISATESLLKGQAPLFLAAA